MARQNQDRICLSGEELTGDMQVSILEETAPKINGFAPFRSNIAFLGIILKELMITTWTGMVRKPDREVVLKDLLWCGQLTIRETVTLLKEMDMATLHWINMVITTGCLMLIWIVQRLPTAGLSSNHTYQTDRSGKTISIRRILHMNRTITLQSADQSTCLSVMWMKWLILFHSLQKSLEMQTLHTHTLGISQSLMLLMLSSLKMAFFIKMQKLLQSKMALVQNLRTFHLAHM